MRSINHSVADTADMLDYYDGTADFRSVAHLQAIVAQSSTGVAFPVSGDDVARLTVREPQP